MVPDARDPQEPPPPNEATPELLSVLESAARLQQLGRVMKVALAFRNLRVDPRSPVDSWPTEAVQTALERGDLEDWRRLVDAVRADPWGRTARQIEEVLSHSRPYGVADAFEDVIRRIRHRAEAAERESVALEVRTLVARSGLSRSEFASRIGTSASRLSTYVTGKVTPSAALLLRMRRVARSGAQ